MDSLLRKLSFILLLGMLPISAVVIYQRFVMQGDWFCALMVLLLISAQWHVYICQNRIRDLEAGAPNGQ